MKVKFLIYTFYTALNILLFLGCAKDDNKIEESTEYVLEKTRYQEFDDGKLTYDEWNYNDVKANLIFSSNNKVELIYFDIDDEKGRIEIGVHNKDKQIIYFDDFDANYYFENNYIVLVTEDYVDNEGYGDKSSAYFKKKK